jgi:alkylation response protein AidB-like acyl-CoA dehydrogenase
MGYDQSFSRKLGARGWIGMTWPRVYGGGERSAMERYIVIEELLAAGAPVAAHWIADRQSGPLLLHYGSEAQRQRWLPGITRGEITFCIGMSEPDAGSDLASLRTRATPVAGGWLLNGTKIWTTLAQYADAMIALVRTSGQHGDRQQGLSQILIDLTLPGITVRPIADMTGVKHFCEVFFEDVFIGADALVGAEGEGWQQVTAELSLERSGPERYLSSYVLVEELIRRAAATGDQTLIAPIGNIVAELWTLRTMSLAVTAKLGTGNDPVVAAAMVKDIGNRFEQEVPRVVQAIVDCDLRPGIADDLGQALAVLLQLSPSFSLRGGTREVLRGIIARGLGLR